MKELMGLTEQLISDMTPNEETHESSGTSATPTSKRHQSQIKETGKNRRESIYEEVSRPSTSSLRSTFPVGFETVTEIKDDEAECKKNGGNLIEIDSDRTDACHQIKSVGYTVGFNGKRKEKRTLSVDNVLFADEDSAHSHGSDEDIST